MVVKNSAVFFLLLMLALPLAENYVAINSIDGRDVLSGIFYANVMGYPVKFVPYPSAGGSDAFAAKVGTGHEILLIQSASTPASGLAESSLRASGNTLETYSTTDGGRTNLDLAVRSGAKTFILVDSAYSDSALSVLAYAARTKAYVILTDSGNAEEVAQIVSGKKVIVYGFIDSSVKSAISSTNPTYIGKGEDKYEDNTIIVSKLIEEFGANRAILADGTLIEDAMADGSVPIVLSGRIVPQVTYDFLKTSFRSGKLEGLLLIGNSLVYPTYDMRERMKGEFASEGKNISIGVLVKFAQSSGGAVSGLDTFSLPTYKPSLKINEIFYNQGSKKVALGLENTGEGPLYYTSEIRVKANGADLQVFTKSQPGMIERGAASSEEYPLDISSVQEGAVSATVLVKYGASAKSLEEFATSDGKLASINYVDRSNVTVSLAKYDASKSILSVTLRNRGEQTAYSFTHLSLVDENSEKVSVSGSSIREIGPNSLFVEEFPLRLSEKEVELNKEVPITIDYGARRGFLTNKATYVVTLEQDGGAGQIQPLLVGGIAAAALLAIMYIIYRLFTKKKGKGAKS